MNHHRNLKDNRLVKFPQVKSRKLVDFLQPVHKRIPMYKQLARRFRYIQVIFKKFVYGKDCFRIKQGYISLFEYLLQKQFAKLYRQLINQTSYSEVVIV